MYKRFLKVLLLIFIILITPYDAYAHGVEQVTPYLGFSAFLIGLFAGVICSFKSVSLQDALFPSFGIYIILIFAGSFLLPGDIQWSDIHIVMFMSIVFGVLIGFIPLIIGFISMSFLMTSILKFLKRIKTYK